MIAESVARQAWQNAVNAEAPSSSEQRSFSYLSLYLGCAACICLVGLPGIILVMPAIGIAACMGASAVVILGIATCRPLRAARCVCQCGVLTWITGLFFVVAFVVVPGLLLMAPWLAAVAGTAVPVCYAVMAMRTACAHGLDLLRQGRIRWLHRRVYAAYVREVEAQRIVAMERAVAREEVLANFVLELPERLRQAAEGLGIDIPISTAKMVAERTELLTMPKLGGGTSADESGDVAASEAEDDLSCCSICYSAIEPGERARRLPCQHLFHATCADRWLLNYSTLCPNCRSPIEEGPRLSDRLSSSHRRLIGGVMDSVAGDAVRQPILSAVRELGPEGALGRALLDGGALRV